MKELYSLCEWGSRAAAATGKKLYWLIRFWSRWSAASCRRGESEKVCVQGGRGQPQSFLLASGSWRCTGPGGMEDCNQSKFSEERMISSSGPSSLAVAAEEVRMDSVTVNHHWLDWRRKSIPCCAFLRSWVMMVARKVSTNQELNVLMICEPVLKSVKIHLRFEPDLLLSL